MIVGIQNEILKLKAMGLLDKLLQDKTTKSNILWATDAYSIRGQSYDKKREITADLITGNNSDIIKNRACKALDTQNQRTKKHAEVFTPLWICKQMNDYADEIWFDRKGVFDEDKITFPKGKTWKSYVDARRLEITCGEAPYLVSRYDASTGEYIAIKDRIGILDRKLRVINENVNNKYEWLAWVIRAFQATYGYEYQGDNILIARVNLMMTFEEYAGDRWNQRPAIEEYRKIARIIAWNIWQMDGLTMAVPYTKAAAMEENCQITLFNLMGGNKDTSDNNKKCQSSCRVFDWRSNNSLCFTDLMERGKRSMKFDFIIGNPPYQETMEGTSDNPIYNKFMDAVFPIADKVELITPARFLFNAGKTPTSWNKKMLADEHFQVLWYEPDSSKVFSNTGFKGGVVITYRDSAKNFGAIKIFTAYPELNTIIKKVVNRCNSFLSNIVYAPESYKFTKELYVENPNIKNMTINLKGKEVPLISKGHDYDLTSNIFDKLYEIVFFSDELYDNMIQIFGRKDNQRLTLYIKRNYIGDHSNLDKYKVFFPKANGSGKFGEVMAESDIGKKGVGHTQTFISIGAFDTLEEAEHLQKYLNCKFTRALLYVLKVTQDNKKSVWKYVPLQDFTSNSDIDWPKSISEIDQQLYAKYGLDDREIQFIESHVKEME